MDCITSNYLLLITQSFTIYFTILSKIEEFLLTQILKIFLCNFFFNLQ